MVTASGGPGGPVGRIAGQGCLELRGDSRKEHSGLLPFTQDRGNRVPVEELSAAPAAAQQLALPRSGGVEEMHNPLMTSFTRSPRCLHVSSRAATCRATHHVPRCRAQDQLCHLTSAPSGLAHGQT